MTFRQQLKLLKNDIKKADRKAFLTLGLSAALIAGCFKDTEFEEANLSKKVAQAGKKNASNNAASPRLHELGTPVFDPYEYQVCQDTLKALKEIFGDIDKQNHKWVELEQKADSLGRAIANKHTYLYMSQARALFEKYDLSAPKIEAKQDYTENFVAHEDGKYVKQFFIAPMKQYHADALQTLEQSAYNNLRKKQIQSKIEMLYQKETKAAQKEQQAARRSLEKQYILYYPALEDIGVDLYGYIENKDGIPHYVRSYKPLYQHVARYELTSVYAKNLPADFFEEPDATYRLKELKPNTWQVEKISAQGKISTTKTFHSQAQRKSYECGFDDFRDVEHQDQLTFKFGQNKGILLEFTRLSELKSGQNDARWSTNEVKEQKARLKVQIEQLTQQIEDMEKAKAQIPPKTKILIDNQKNNIR